MSTALTTQWALTTLHATWQGYILFPWVNIALLSGGANSLAPVFLPHFAHKVVKSMVSITFSFRPDKVMFDLAWGKLVYDLKTISSRATKELHNNYLLQV